MTLLKNLLLASLVFFLVPTVTNAQGGFSFGIKGGYNFTMLQDKNIADSIRVDPVSFGWHGGIHIGWNMSRYNVGFTTALNYKQYNQKIEHQKAKGWKAENRVSYLEVPLLLRIRPRGDMLRKTVTYGGFYFELGPQIGFVSSADYSYSDSTANYGGDVKSSFEKINWAMVVGVGGHQFGLENFSLTHGLRLTYGLGDIIVPNTGSEGYPIQDQAGKTSTLPYNNPVRAISVGYIMALTFKVDYKRN